MQKEPLLCIERDLFVDILSAHTSDNAADVQVLLKLSGADLVRSLVLLRYGVTVLVDALLLATAEQVAYPKHDLLAEVEPETLPIQDQLEQEVQLLLLRVFGNVTPDTAVILQEVFGLVFVHFNILLVLGLHFFGSGDPVVHHRLESVQSLPSGSTRHPSVAAYRLPLYVKSLLRLLT